MFPAKAESSLIMRHGRHSDDFLEEHLAEAAQRLAATFHGQPVDDLILIPWLYLYRHAMELTMKRSILYAVGLRRNNGEEEPSLDSEVVADRLSKKHKHRLGAILNELQVHLGALDLPPVPSDAAKIVQLLGELDPAGLSFRYSEQLPDSVDRIDFVQMNAAIATAYTTVAAALDVLCEYGDVQSDYLDEMRQIQAEIEADLRDDY